jgi:hypothetical protein
VLKGGKYSASESLIFPDLAIAQMIPAIVERSWQVGNYQALEELEETLVSGS